MKFFSVAVVVALFCAVTVSAAPFTNDLTLSDEDSFGTFGLTETVTRLLNALIEKTKCTLDVIEDVIKGTELEDVFKKFRAEIKSILKNDVKKCWNTEGGLGKLKCTLGVSKKVNSLYLNFIKDVLKTNVEVAKKILKSLVKCAKKQPDQTEQPEFFSNEDIDSDAIDSLLKALDEVMKKMERLDCAFDAIGDLLDGSELAGVFNKFQAEVDSIFDNDMKQCNKVEDFVGQVKCTLAYSQKLDKLFADFMNKVVKTSGDLGEQVHKAVLQCEKKSMF